MTRKLVRATLVLAAFAVLVPSSGCIKMKQDLVVYADGSGKMVFTFAISQAFIDKMKEGPGGGGEVEEKMGLDKEDLENLEGIVAMARPVKSEKDGWKSVAYTAYFEDINKVKLWNVDGDKKKLQIGFVFKKEGDGFTLDIDDRFLSDDDEEKQDEMPDDMKDQIWAQVQPLLKGFEVVNAVKMPGKVTAVDGYATKEGRTASSKVTEEQIKKIDDLKKTMTKAKRKVTCGKDEGDADKAAFQKELAEAKAAWPALKKELMAEAEKNKKDKEPKGMDD